MPFSTPYVFHAALSGWEGWPFSGYGYEGGLWPTITRMLFVLVLFVAIALFLRFLFGPKGRFRGEDWETIQDARKRRAQEAAASGAPTETKNGSHDEAARKDDPAS